GRPDWSGPSLLRSSALLGRGGLGFAENQLQGHLPPAAQNGHADRVARLMLVEDGCDVLRLGNLPPIDRDDQVAAQQDLCIPYVCAFVSAMQAGTIGCAARDDLLNQD